MYPAAALFRRQDHHHLTAFQLRFGFDLGDTERILLDLQQKLEAEFLVGHFTAAELQRHFYLVAFFEEAVHRLHLHLIVMGVDVRAHLDFFDFDDLLLLAGFGGFFLRRILQLAEIENLADRRFGIGRDFYEIEASFFRKLESLVGRDDTEILAFGIDKLNFRDTDFPVGARPVLDWGIGFERSANGRILL